MGKEVMTVGRIIEAPYLWVDGRLIDKSDRQSFFIKTLRGENRGKTLRIKEFGVVGERMGFVETNLVI